MADILSQEEIDALLEVVDGDGDTDDIQAHSNESGEQKQIIIYDFKRPNRVSKEQLRAINLHVT